MRRIVHPFPFRLLLSLAASAAILGGAILILLLASGEWEALHPTGESDILWGSALNQDHPIPPTNWKERWRANPGCCSWDRRG